MNLETLRAFFFWCTMVNVGVYALTACLFWAFRDLACKLQSRLIGVDETTALKTTYSYLAAYKLLVLVFNFTPWIALVILT